MQFSVISNDMDYQELDLDEMDKYYGFSMGMLKINPGRMPVIMSPEQGIVKKVCWSKNSFETIRIFDGNYYLVVDDKSLEYWDECSVLSGNGFIVKRQEDKFVDLTLNDLLHISKYLDELEKQSNLMTQKDDSLCGCYIFPDDMSTGN